MLSRKKIHVFINAISASAGGGLTYVRNVLPHLVARDDVHTTVLVSELFYAEIRECDGLTLVRTNCPTGSARRLWYEQWELPGVISQSGANVLLSPGNFALYRSPVPQILLSRNALYISSDFVRDLRLRGDYGLWLDTEAKGTLARWSVRAADCTVAPSAAFAKELRQWTGEDVVAIHHGFDRELFFGDSSPLSHDAQAQMAATEGSLRLLFVSHYNYYRNFETLLHAIAIVKQKLYPRTVRLVLTCTLNSKDNRGDYRAESAAALVKQLGIGREIVELGSVPYASLHNLYRACNLYVTPSYAETFAHPLVEAMASGLPVVGSDLPVHREICGDAAVYFPRFSAEALAQRVIQASQSPEQTAAMREMGLIRSQSFSWGKHVDALLQVARRLARSGSSDFA